MPVTFDPSGDFEMVVDGLEPITLLRRGSDETAVTNALRRALRTDEIQDSDGRYVAGDTAWHFPTVEAAEPRLGDVLLDGDGQRYTILDFQEATLGVRYRCVARNLRIVYGLNDTIEILEASFAKGAGGASEPDRWNVRQSGLRARIQPMESEMSVEHEARRTVKRVLIFVETDVDVDHTCRVKARNGTLYKVTGYNGAERIGELATIEAEVTPWPLA